MTVPSILARLKGAGAIGCHKMFELTEALTSELESFDTPTVCNALEIVAPKRRGFGYTTEHLFCIRPQLKQIVGIARTARIRSVHRSELSGEEARRLSDVCAAASGIGD